MCDAGLAMIGAQSAGTAYGTVGSFYATKEKQAGLRAEADMAEINARMSERQAQQALRSGQLRGQQSKLKNAALKSSQKVSLAANGVDLGSDSAVALLTTTDLIGEIDSNEIAKEAVNSAWGYRIQGTNAKNTAIMNRSQASSLSPYFSAGSTMLTGATSVAQSAYLYNKYNSNSEGSKK